MSRIHAITIPKWGIEMQEGTITSWHVDIGGTVTRGAQLLDVETEKIVNTVEASVEGTLSRIIGSVGDTLPVGALVGIVCEGEVSEADIDRFVREFKAADASFEPETSAGASEAATSAAPAAERDDEARVSPIARRLAEKLGVDLSKITGTGRNGRISKEDVESYHAKQSTAVEAVPMSAMRLAIARRLTESKQTIPHYRLHADVDCAALDASRSQHAAAGRKISVNDLLIFALARTLAEFPDVNACLENDTILRRCSADIALAVSTPGGLITPVIRNADTKDVLQLAEESRELAGKARDNKLTREEITGGSFTLSNLGMFGIDAFDAVINPPQVAILAVGSIRDVVVLRNGSPAAGRLMTLTLSCDHRVVDGALGARFLSALKQRIEGGIFV
ncbi:MAG: 2-oxo acid dehydrogenase subunit E2 [Gammaproteobacteria bacterium]|nr:2-oxo acid dehydrogenase subunit E2 [Gammaproteobacteria bacterium]